MYLDLRVAICCLQWKCRLGFLVLILTAAVLSGCYPSTSLPRLPESVFIEKNAPMDSALWKQQSAVDSSGAYSAVTLPEGKFIAVFWASWCPHCWAEHPYLVELAGQGVNMVGVLFRDTTADAVNHLHKFGNPYALVVDDRHGQLRRHTGVDSIPTVVVFDSAHRYRARIIGGLQRRRWEDQGLADWYHQLP